MTEKKKYATEAYYLKQIDKFEKTIARLKDLIKRSIDRDPVVNQHLISAEEVSRILNDDTEKN
jgi:cell fate (sporulation/competence/biofilm development) regulator YmcA (YheA/YmcA/DUF963 family)